MCIASDRSVSRGSETTTESLGRIRTRENALGIRAQQGAGFEVSTDGQQAVWFIQRLRGRRKGVMQCQPTQVRRGTSLHPALPYSQTGRGDRLSIDMVSHITRSEYAIHTRMCRLPSVPECTVR